MQQMRWMGKKIRRKKGPVESLSESPNSVAAMMTDREIPRDMDLREVWDRTTDKKQRQMAMLEVYTAVHSCWIEH